MNLPVRVRLTLWCAGLMAVIIVCLGALLEVQLRSDLRHALDEEALVTARSLLSAVVHENDDEELGDRAEELDDFVEAAATSVQSAGAAQLLDGDGNLLVAYGKSVGVEPIVDARTQAGLLADGSRVHQADLDRPGQPHRVTAIAFADADRPRIVAVAVSLQPVDDAVHRVLVLLLTLGPLALAAASFAAYWLARRALRPVQLMTSDAQEIGAGQLHERVAVPHSQDELRRLAVTLNDMLARIERGVKDRQRLVADASHELRTPLAVMRAELDVSLRQGSLPAEAREVLESAREEVDRMARAVDNLLALGRLEEGRLELLTEPVDLRHAVADAAGPLVSLAAAKDVRLVTDGQSCRALADPHRLKLALTNIIENAIKFTPPGGTVSARTWSRDEEIGVAVDDEGPGIPDTDRAQLFERYFRGDDPSSGDVRGTGLGLAIAKEIAAAHGGRIWVEDRPLGGSTFSIAVPSWRALPAQLEHDSAGSHASTDVRSRT
jgi:two-component system OmpR family sensor kinase